MNALERVRKPAEPMPAKKKKKKGQKKVSGKKSPAASTAGTSKRAGEQDRGVVDDE